MRKRSISGRRRANNKWILIYMLMSIAFKLTDIHFDFSSVCKWWDATCFSTYKHLERLLLALLLNIHLILEGIMHGIISNEFNAYKKWVKLILISTVKWYCFNSLGSDAIYNKQNKAFLEILGLVNFSKGFNNGERDFWDWITLCVLWRQLCHCLAWRSTTYPRAHWKWKFTLFSNAFIIELTVW